MNIEQRYFLHRAKAYCSGWGESITCLTHIFGDSFLNTRWNPGHCTAVHSFHSDLEYCRQATTDNIVLCRTEEFTTESQHPLLPKQPGFKVVIKLELFLWLQSQHSCLFFLLLHTSLPWKKLIMLWFSVQMIYNRGVSASESFVIFDLCDVTKQKKTKMK